MKKIITISMWEYLEKVKTKAFIISLIVTPIILIMVTLLPTLLARDENPEVELIGVIDTSGVYFQFLSEEFQKYELPDGQKNYVMLNLNRGDKSFEELKKNSDKDVSQ
jgi:ABC-2 type transport system permease protein